MHVNVLFCRDIAEYPKILEIKPQQIIAKFSDGTSHVYPLVVSIEPGSYTSVRKYPNEGRLLMVCFDKIIRCLFIIILPFIIYDAYLLFTMLILYVDCQQILPNCQCVTLKFIGIILFET